MAKTLTDEQARQLVDGLDDAILAEILKEV